MRLVFRGHAAEQRMLNLVFLRNRTKEESPQRLAYAIIHTVLRWMGSKKVKEDDEQDKRELLAKKTQ